MKQFWWILAAMLIVNWVIAAVFAAPAHPKRLTVPYTFFREQVQLGNIKEVTSRAETIEGEFRTEITFPAEPDGHTNTRFKTERPAFADDQLLELMIQQGVVVNARPPQDTRAWWETLLLGFGPTVLLVVGYVWLMRRMSHGAGGIGGMGKAKATRYEEGAARTTFADVAGIDEATVQLAEIVDFLRNPDRYRALGARIPKGVLLTGPPGTGKTLLARALAGEANVPFLSMSASEFIEMIVGVGASRVRDLFAQAKAQAPAIIFIDELDAIGRARGGSVSFGGVDEREQTLNQILTEMDGFTGSEGVIVLAATNRGEILDPALLRPGRFDRHIVINPPDQAGRAKILAVHTRGVPLNPDVDLSAIAATTSGMVGADLANLVNEAALLAARRNHTAVHLADVTDALEQIVLGAERKIMLSPEERRRTAYHEAGHALLGMLQPGADPVRKVSIIPRGRALGVTFQSPAADRYGYNADDLRGRIVGALGGRAAEEIVLGNTSTGAESDLEQITAIARQMVGRWGMSAAVGPVSVLPPPGDSYAPFGHDGRSPADSTRELVDAEVRRIIDECYTDAVNQLRAHLAQLDAVAHALLEHETLDEADAYAAAGIEHSQHPGTIHSLG